MENPLLTVDEVAIFLRKSSKWVYTQKDQIPGYFKLGGSIFFDREILVKHLKELAAKPTPKVSRSRTDKHGLL
jgi:hypothetical protein